jgi:hypothetical protein
MGWSIGYDNRWHRDIGYGVPATCDFLGCNKEINRGLSYVCGSDPLGGDYGCGLYFCGEHFKGRKPHGSENYVQLCPRCYAYKSPYNPKPDVKAWIKWKLTDESWARWRKENKSEVNILKTQIKINKKSYEKQT